VLQNLLDAIDSIRDDSDKIGRFLNGCDDETVDTDCGEIPTLAGFIKQSKGRVDNVIDDYEQTNRDAQSAMEAAQAARDAAMIDGRYETVADGLSDTSDGDIFTVVKPDHIIVYKNSSGSEEELYRTFAQSKLRDFYQGMSAKQIWGSTDLGADVSSAWQTHTIVLDKPVGSYTVADKVLVYCLSKDFLDSKGLDEKSGYDYDHGHFRPLVFSYEPVIDRFYIDYVLTDAITGGKADFELTRGEVNVIDLNNVILPKGKYLGFDAENYTVYEGRSPTAGGEQAWFFADGRDKSVSGSSASNPRDPDEMLQVRFEWYSLSSDDEKAHQARLDQQNDRVFRGDAYTDEQIMSDGSYTYKVIIYSEPLAHDTLIDEMIVEGAPRGINSSSDHNVQAYFNPYVFSKDETNEQFVVDWDLTRKLTNGWFRFFYAREKYNQIPIKPTIIPKGMYFGAYFGHDSGALVHDVKTVPQQWYHSCRTAPDRDSIPLSEFQKYPVTDNRAQFKIAGTELSDNQARLYKQINDELGRVRADSPVIETRYAVRPDALANSGNQGMFLFGEDLMVCHNSGGGKAPILSYDRHTLERTHHDLSQSVGHFNSASYSPQLDALVANTKGGSGTEKDANSLWVFPNISNKVDSHHEITRNDGVVIPLWAFDDPDDAYPIRAVVKDIRLFHQPWSPMFALDEDPRVVYLWIADGLGSNAVQLVKMFLGMGDHDLSSQEDGWGSFISGRRNDEFNGTARLLGSWFRIESDKHIYTQDSCFWGGHFYWGYNLREDDENGTGAFRQNTVRKYKPMPDGSLRLVKIYEAHRYHDDGTLWAGGSSQNETQGVTTDGVYLYATDHSRGIYRWPIEPNSPMQGKGTVGERVNFPFRLNSKPMVFTSATGAGNVYVVPGDVSLTSFTASGDRGTEFVWWAALS
jgi:hypothetical protein